MQICDIINILETWAPPWTAWERDNVGLQVGDANRAVDRVLIALDVTHQVIEEATRKKAGMIISHHPLLFRMPSAIRADDPVGRLVLLLAERKIASFAAHTNLDFAPEGVSFSLARALGLRNIRFLSPLGGLMAKLAVFVPQGHVESVRAAMSNAGAGIIGEYSSCSFESAGRGTFRGSPNSKPFIGTPGELETAEEVRLEMVLPRAKTSAVVQAMKSAHPYDEVAYDLVHVENPTTNAGMGAIGELPAALTPETFLRRVGRSLRTAGLRHTSPSTRTIRTVAVCSGSGSDMLSDAVRSGADAFVTADVRYHSYHAATGKILLVDAGHFETENVIVPVIASRLKNAVRARGATLQVVISQQSTNPVRSTSRASA